MNTVHLSYTRGRLDRAANFRKDEAWIAQKFSHSETKFIPVWRSRNFLTGLQENDAPTVVSFSQDSATNFLDMASQVTFLGLDDESPVFAADLSGHEEDQVIGLLNHGEFLDLRQVGPLMHPAEAALSAYARGMLHWHQQHQFCSRCGTTTESRQGGHMRQCQNSECARESYPRTDPAIIVLVEDRETDPQLPKCLLGSHNRLPNGVYTTLAGFVEPGENLEEAVAREILEESGIKVKNVDYQASQPWPFPSSIMLGFRAQADSTSIQVDQDEINDARWFTAEEIKQFGEWGDDSASYRLPRKDSIARMLIETWMYEV
ncbi:NAD(+) diphosphatase [Pseudomonadota bacterium]